MDKKAPNLIVALTGGIGSGKSTVGGIFKELGACVIDSDHIVHELLGANSPLVDPIKNHFGSKVINSSDNSINHKVLGDLVFDSPDDRLWLENLIHPLVYKKLWEIAAGSTEPYCVMLIPLLFESGHEKEFNRVLVVDVSESSQITRVKQRNNFDEGKIRKIIAAQVSREERLMKTDDVINNEVSLVELKNQVGLLHEKYLKNNL